MSTCQTPTGRCELKCGSPCRREGSSLPVAYGEWIVKPATFLAGAITITLLAGPGLVATALAAESRGPQDLQIENCLSQAEIVEEVEVLVGITSPLRFVIECDGARHQAIFKHVDEVRRGRTRFGSGRSEINFTDSYKYERAAYLLDRELGINRVPVAVIRKVRGQDGALVQWIENASMENQLDRKLTTRELIDLASQKRTMHLFDALIYNTDRIPENWLIGADDLELYLIDHSRAFRWQHELPDDFSRKPARLSRELFAELQSLSKPGITDLLEGLIDQAQVGALLARRDLILQKISKDLGDHGEAIVFTE